MLAQSVGPALTKHMHEILNLMFAYGLSAPLHDALVALGRDIPPLLPEIQERMLDLLSVILSGEPFTQAGAPTKHLLPRDPVPEAQDDATIQLALEVLRTFNFKGIFQVGTSPRSGVFSRLPSLSSSTRS